MSREIIYRVWDDENKSYNDPYSYAYYAMTQDGGLDFYCHGDCMGEANPDTYIIEQYTGLKDKNGKEIYEGDIIKCWSQDTYPVGRVMYSEEWCTYEIVSYDPKDCRVYNLESFSPTVNKYLEVIGNIHENPELLEKGEENE